MEIKTDGETAEGIPSPVRPTALAWWRARAPGGPFWSYFVAFLIFAFAYCTYFFLYSLMLVDLRYTEASIGAIVGVMSVGSLAGTIPAGILASRFGLRRILIFSVLLTAFFSALRALMPWYSVQLMLALFSGMTLSGWAVCSTPAVAHLTDESKRPFAFSLTCGAGIAMGAFGGIVGGLLPGYLQTLSLHRNVIALSPLQAKQITLLLICAVALLPVIPVARLPMGIPTDRPTSLRRPHPFLLKFLPAVALWSFVIGSFAPFANVYFSRHLGVPLQHIGFIFSVSQTAQFITVLFAPFLLRRLGLGSFVMATQMIAAVALAWLAFTHTAAQAMGLYWIYISVQYMGEPGIFTLLMDRVPKDQQNNASAMNFLVIGLAQSVAAAAVGRAFTRFGYTPVFLSLAVLASVSGVVFRGLTIHAIAENTSRVDASSLPA